MFGRELEVNGRETGGWRVVTGQDDGEEEAATTVARRRAVAVGLLPQPSLSSHLRWRSLLSFFK